MLRRQRDGSCRRSCGDPRVVLVPHPAKLDRRKLSNFSQRRRRRVCAAAGRRSSSHRPPTKISVREKLNRYRGRLRLTRAVLLLLPAYDRTIDPTSLSLVQLELFLRVPRGPSSIPNSTLFPCFRPDPVCVKHTPGGCRAISLRSPPRSAHPIALFR